LLVNFILVGLASTDYLLLLMHVCSDDPSKWPKSVVDVGCGIGGSSRYLAKKFGASCVGITLSPVQAERANALAVAQGLADKVFLSVHFILYHLFFYTFYYLILNVLSNIIIMNLTKGIKNLYRIESTHMWPMQH
jgi:tocopherol O-methyltransferase